VRTIQYAAKKKSERKIGATYFPAFWPSIGRRVVEVVELTNEVSVAV
jgi:hypothetical protein